MRSQHRAVLAGLLAIVLTAGMALADVMQQVPGGALVVVKVRNLQEVSQNVGNLAQRWGLADFSPEFADPLGSFRESMEIEQGLRDEGEMAFAFFAPADAEGEGRAVMLLPVSDYEAFVGNFEEMEEAEGITEVISPEGETLYVARRGEYAVLSPSREVVAMQPQGVAMAGLTAQQAQENDATVVLNLEAVRPLVMPFLTERREELLGRLEQELRDNNQERFVPLARAAAGQAMNLAQGFMTQAQGMTFGLRFREEGINSTFMAEFQPGSEWAQSVRQIRNTDESLLEGLPEARYLAFGGSVQDPQASAQLISKLLDPIEAELRQLGEQARPFVRYVEALKSMTAGQEQTRFAMFAPTGMLGQTSLVQFLSIATGDARAMADAQRQMFQTQQDIVALFQDEAMRMEMTYTVNERQVEGVMFDRFSTDFEIDPQTPEAAQAQMMLGFMYGPDGFNGFTGIVNDQHLVTLAGGTEATLASVVRAVREGEDPMAARQPVQTVAGRLPGERAAVVYVPVDVIVSTAVNFVGQFGFPVPLQLPPDLPPVGMTVASQEDAVRVDTHLPSQLVESLISAAMQMFMGQPGMGPRPGEL